MNNNKIKLFGIKLGMSTMYKNYYNIPITLIKIFDNRIFNINENENFLNIKIVTNFCNSKKKYNKPIIGIFNKYKTLFGRILYEFNINKSFSYLFKLNSSISFNILNDINKISITSKSKGKGFSGVIKRWNFSKQDSSHGNSLSHRSPGSIGQNQSPGRVFKGKKMSGHYGNKNITIKNVKILDINSSDNVLIVKGSLPGSNKSILTIKYDLNEKK